MVKQSLSDAIDYIGDTDIVKAQKQTLKGAYDVSNTVAPRATKFVSDLAETSNLIPAFALGKKFIPSLPGMETKTLRDVVDYGFKKGIKPSVAGKSDAGLTAKFYDNAETAVKEQVERYPDALPTKVEEFAKTTRQAKKGYLGRVNIYGRSGGGERGNDFCDSTPPRDANHCRFQECSKISKRCGAKDT